MTPERWHKIEQLCQAALQLQGEERATYLREACAEDYTLRQEVESLLRQSNTDEFLETPALYVMSNMETQKQLEFSLEGRQIGSYKILSLVGSGGMGEVYRAYDVKLGRDVAIKVLPAAIACDSERLARFRREAKILASLSHPKICTIYQLEVLDGTYYLIMELVAGETLRRLLAHEGSVRTEKALNIAVQIAEALEAAHEKGLVHRDLKPANVMVTDEGAVKVLDFGLAKKLADITADGSGSHDLSAGATAQGMLLGTAAYMSPEQVEGKFVDTRTDIWAFGCVLYELLTGKQAFGGETITETLAAILRGEPNWEVLPPSTPVSIRILLRRCLKKDKALRLQAAGDARIEIHEALAETAARTTAPPLTRPVRAQQRLTVAGLIAVGLFALLGVTTWYFKPPVQPLARSAHLDLALPSGSELAPANIPLEISPDGTELVYVGVRGGIRQLYLRQLGKPEHKAIPGTEGATSPFFSPDGRWVGFFAQGKIKKVSKDGGVPITLCDADIGGGASWGADDTIVFSAGRDSGLRQISAAGGQPQDLTTPDPGKGDYSHRYPQILPGGKAVIFTAFDGVGWDESRVELLRLDSKERSVLVRGGNTARFVTGGHLIYYRAGSLLAVPFDLTRLQVQSSVPVTIAAGVRQSEGAVGGDYSISAGGTLVYVPASPSQFESQLVWLDRQGNIQPIGAPPRAYSSPAVSPDGKQVAITITSEKEQIWTFDLSRGSLNKVSSEKGSSRDSIWTPDGKRLVYRSNRTGKWNLFWRSSDGSGPEERLTMSESIQIPGSFSPDGRVVAFTQTKASTDSIWLMRIDGHSTQLFAQTSAANEYGGQFSPDGRWLAYESDESGGSNVYVQAYQSPGRKWRISPGGGEAPRWNRNGRELFYLHDGKMMAVNVTTSTFSAGPPKVLFENHDISNIGWDVSPDGRRFLIIKSSDQTTSLTQIAVVLNWFEELKSRIAYSK